MIKELVKKGSANECRYWLDAFSLIAIREDNDSNNLLCEEAKKLKNLAPISEAECIKISASLLLDRATAFHADLCENQFKLFVDAMEKSGLANKLGITNFSEKLKQEFRDLLNKKPYVITVIRDAFEAFTTNMNSKLYIVDKLCGFCSEFYRKISRLINFLNFIGISELKYSNEDLEFFKIQTKTFIGMLSRRARELSTVSKSNELVLSMRSALESICKISKNIFPGLMKGTRQELGTVLDVILHAAVHIRIIEFQKRIASCPIENLKEHLRSCYQTFCREMSDWLEFVLFMGPKKAINYEYELEIKNELVGLCKAINREKEMGNLRNAEIGEVVGLIKQFYSNEIFKSHSKELDSQLEKLLSNNTLPALLFSDNLSGLFPGKSLCLHKIHTNPVDYFPRQTIVY